MSAFTRRLGTYRKYIRTLVAQGKLDNAAKLAEKHRVSVPELDAALAAQAATTGGEGVRPAPGRGNSDQSSPSGDFPQLAERAGVGAAMNPLVGHKMAQIVGAGSREELERVRREVAKRLEAMRVEDGVAKGEAGKVVKVNDEVGAKVGRGRAVAAKKEEAEPNESDSQTESCGEEKPLGANDVLEREIAERKRLAAERPWPEECEARVCGGGGKWQMAIELVEPDGREPARKTWVWKGGYNLYVQERLRVKLVDRLGEDTIYGVVERLADPTIEPKINRVGTVESFRMTQGAPKPKDAPVVAESVPVTATLGDGMASSPASVTVA